MIMIIPKEKVLDLYKQGKNTRDIARAKDVPKRHQRHFKKESSKSWNGNGP
jgi:hypothetical protein